ncbi:MAG TPA: glucosamine-6-phosphate deaminase [Verrucomicrobiales bacterium]|nr:glucosamine-6-phosphate deaminase [Verrucomicrobiales bacterium]
MNNIQTFQVDQLAVRVYPGQAELSTDVAKIVHDHLVDTIAARGAAAAIMATGNSQIQFLEKLVALGGIDWGKVTLFHMDEYLGITGEHSASFRRYMRERVESRVKPKVFHYLTGEADLPLDECARYANLLRMQPIDLCCLGVGENGHLAFNDPHVADFRDPHWVKLVRLDDACKMQQVNEKHFPSLEAVPPYAYTLTIPALLAAKKVICVAPEKRKAKAVKAALHGPVSAECPASALRHAPQATLFLDGDSTSLL